MDGLEVEFRTQLDLVAHNYLLLALLRCSISAINQGISLFDTFCFEEWAVLPACQDGRPCKSRGVTFNLSLF
jgi:hypothetical protein